MMKFTKILLLASTAAAIILPRDATSVQNDINQKIGPIWTTLENDINAYPASGLLGVFAIHDDVQNLIVATDDTTSDILASGSFSEADGSTILADLQSLVSTILNTLSAIGSQTETWNLMPGGESLILSEFQSLNSSSMAFINALIVASPADLVPLVTSVETQILAGFNSVISAYSS